MHPVVQPAVQPVDNMWYRVNGISLITLLVPVEQSIRGVSLYDCLSVRAITFERNDV